MNKYYEDTNTTIKSEMNVVPMIDVLLVLLIVFMIASPLVSSSVDINLPKTSTSQATVEQNEQSIVIITIDKKENLYLTNTALGIVDEKKDPKALVNELAAIKKKQPNAELFLKADKDSPYKLVMFGLELTKAAGFENANLVTEERG